MALGLLCSEVPAQQSLAALVEQRAVAGAHPRGAVTLAGMTGIQPELWVGQAAEAVAFYGAAFGARVLHQVGEGDEIVAQLAVGDAGRTALARPRSCGRSGRMRKNSFGACSLSMARYWLSARERSR
jgi:hypothetical protein